MSGAPKPAFGACICVCPQNWFMYGTRKPAFGACICICAELLRRSAKVCGWKRSVACRFSLAPVVLLPCMERVCAPRVLRSFGSLPFRECVTSATEAGGTDWMIDIFRPELDGAWDSCPNLGMFVPSTVACGHQDADHIDPQCGAAALQLSPLAAAAVGHHSAWCESTSRCRIQAWSKSLRFASFCMRTFNIDYRT